MPQLTNVQRLIELLEQGQELPADYKHLLFVEPQATGRLAARKPEYAVAPAFLLLRGKKVS